MVFAHFRKSESDGANPDLFPCRVCALDIVHIRLPLRPGVAADHVGPLGIGT